MKNCIFGYHEHKPIEQIKSHSCNHSHEHNHEHTHEHRGGDKKVLKLAFIITFITMFIEFTVGFMANSLALISDAIHMFTHSFALIISLVAIIIASKKAPLEKTFGYYRIEVLAAFVNGLTILLSIFWILYEAIERFFNPLEIDITQSLVVATLGLIVNIITGVILMQGDRENINLKSAFLHMLTDAISSVAIIIGLIVIYYTNLYIIDTLLALIVSVVIGKWSYGLLRDSINTLLESSPVNINKLKADIESSFDDIIDIHDIHIWEVTHKMFNLTAHVKIKNSSLNQYQNIINEINKKLVDSYHINHSTLQLEWDITKN